MTRVCLILACCFFAEGTFASESPKQDCATRLNQLKMQINVANSNIANVQSTRTPEGGPYKPKRLDCGEHGCDLVTIDRAPLLKYEPDHPDTNDEGYVAYPNINLMSEMGDVIDRTKEYEAMKKTCSSTR